VPRSAPVDEFTLVYERSGSRPAVVLLHGWPGDRSDYRARLRRCSTTGWT
jgi:pimeloyl-ACP methyl ester carboxylesterase